MFFNYDYLLLYMPLPPPPPPLVLLYYCYYFLLLLLLLLLPLLNYEGLCFLLGTFLCLSLREPLQVETAPGSVPDDGPENGR